MRGIVESGGLVEEKALMYQVNDLDFKDCLTFLYFMRDLSIQTSDEAQHAACAEEYAVNLKRIWQRSLQAYC